MTREAAPLQGGGREPLRLEYRNRPINVKACGERYRQSPGRQPPAIASLGRLATADRVFQTGANEQLPNRVAHKIRFRPEGNRSVCALPLRCRKLRAGADRRIRRPHRSLHKPGDLSPAGPGVTEPDIRTIGFERRPNHHLSRRGRHRSYRARPAFRNRSKPTAGRQNVARRDGPQAGINAEEICAGSHVAPTTLP
jgi:hypothetical protein